MRRRHAWEGFAFEREVKETSDDEGSEAGLKLEVVSLEKRDFDDTGGDRVRCREFIAESFGCWSGSQLIGVGIAMTSATKNGPISAVFGLFLSLTSQRCQHRSTGFRSSG